MTYKAARVIIWESPHIYKTGKSNMWHYIHFTTEEREKSQRLSFRAIAKELGRASSSVNHEFQRNCYANSDCAVHHVDKRYRKRQKNCGRKAKLLDNANARLYFLLLHHKEINIAFPHALPCIPIASSNASIHSLTLLC